MNRTKLMLTVVSIFFALTTSAQGDYIVKTTASKTQVETEDELRFTVENFPYYTICSWRAGQKFMFLVEGKSGVISTLKSLANERDAANNKFQFKLLEYQGTEEVRKETYSGESLSTRFMFEVDGEKYYHEVKNQSLDEICAANPRAFIANLVYLGDVDIARELLMGKTLYTKVAKAFVDDGSVGSSPREVSIPRNLEVTVTAIGAGNRECPVKIVFEDRDGNTYFRNVIFSRTNSGLQNSDLVGANTEKYFPNVFTFTDKEVKTTEDIRSKYVGKAIYPKHIVNAKKEEGSIQSLLRYTPLVVKDIIPDPSSTMATLKLTDKKGVGYTLEVNLKYDIFIRNADYINDMFGFGDLRKQYPGITEENWLMLGNGEVKTGMTKDECMLALGSPIQMVVNTNSRYETWYYQGKMVEFEDGRIARLK